MDLTGSTFWSWAARSASARRSPAASLESTAGRDARTGCALRRARIPASGSGTRLSNPAVGRYRPPLHDPVGVTLGDHVELCLARPHTDKPMRDEPGLAGLLEGDHFPRPRCASGRLLAEHHIPGPIAGSMLPDSTVRDRNPSRRDPVVASVRPAPSPSSVHRAATREYADQSTCTPHWFRASQVTANDPVESPSAAVLF